MRKQFSERTDYNHTLRQLDKNISWNPSSKNHVQNKIIANINRMEQKTRMLKGFKYASSLGIFIVFLFFGYQFLSSEVMNSEESLTEPPSNQIRDSLAMSDVDDKETKGNEEIPSFESSIITDEAVLKDMDVRLPSYIPKEVRSEPRFTKRDHPDGTGVEVKYLESENYFFKFAQSEIYVSQEASIKRVKNEMYKNEVLEEVEIAGHPSFLRLEGDDTSYYSSLHIITDKYFITLTTHGIEKEEILEIAKSIDLTGL